MGCKGTCQHCVNGGLQAGASVHLSQAQHNKTNNRTRSGVSAWGDVRDVFCDSATGGSL